MIDRHLLFSRIDEIQESLNRLEQIKGLDEERFLNDRDLQDIASYRLLVIIEAALSICQHICAREIHKAPDTYAGCFSILEEHNIITPELSNEMQQIARFRNMLVHIYWDIDYRIVHRIINERLSDITDFVSQIMKRYNS